MSVTLIGLQDTAVAAHRPDSDGAAVSVRVGNALVWMHDRATAVTFANVWRGEDDNAAWLPREPAKDRKREMPGREPTVMIESRDSPMAFATLLRYQGERTRMRVVLGRIAFDVRDVGAFRSTAAAFHKAGDVAEEIFLDGRRATWLQRRAEVAEIASRAFISPVGSRYQRMVRARVLPAAARNAPDQRPGRRPHRGGPLR